MPDSLIVVGGAAVAGYFGYQWWQREQVRQALATEAARLQAGGMGIKDSITKAAAGACVAAAAASGLPPATAGPLCNGAAVVAMKAAELTAKGAVIAGKVVGKGAIVVGKGIGKAGAAVGHAGAAVGKTTAKVAVTAVYKAPVSLAKSVIHAPAKIFGGSSKLGRAANNKDVFPNDLAACTRLFGITDWRACGMKYDLKTKAWPWDAKGNLKGIEMYGAALADAAPRRRNPIAEHTRARRPAPASRRAGPAPKAGPAYYAALLR